jgi:lysozyme family protein
MKESFPKALKLVLAHEGGFSDHPRDPGGATMKGVIQRVYDAYRQRKGEDVRSVKKLENAELQEIYRQMYWAKIDGDELPAGLDYCVFDAAVNSGPSQAAKWLQRAINDVLGRKELMIDGNIGPATLRAVEVATLSAVVDAMCDRRMAMLKGLKHWTTFGEGWMNRVEGEEKNGVRKGGVRQTAKTFK